MPDFVIKGCLDLLPEALNKEKRNKTNCGHDIYYFVIKEERVGKWRVECRSGCNQ